MQYFLRVIFSFLFAVYGLILYTQAEIVLELSDIGQYADIDSVEAPPKIEFKFSPSQLETLYNSIDESKKLTLKFGDVHLDLQL